MPKLGVNIDHVATVRQARRGEDPDPLMAALVAEKSGADSIVAHLREDRRHIQDRDILVLRKRLKKRFNLEMSLAPDIVKLACLIEPDQVTLVPERRQEITTEGGLDVIKSTPSLKKSLKYLIAAGIDVSVFIDPKKNQIKAAYDLGIRTIELHTGTYAKAWALHSAAKELDQIKDMTAMAIKLGMVVNAGHGLDYENVKDIARIKGMHELNIGHSIISRSIFDGIGKAVRDMKALIR